ncbi:protein kinase domain-containing protein [Pseudomonas typographi]|uniref:Protein kinase n=1 Tax=Pseudomonas typographi TaxID=2715964 RepID=A0ABR7YXZ3_9PSED|nr:protein kinase [Pseudomonas typographi]MBD1597999.1 protein kinase [Pseudomonas typographi]
MLIRVIHCVPSPPCRLAESPNCAKTRLWLSSNLKKIRNNPGSLSNIVNRSNVPHVDSKLSQSGKKYIGKGGWGEVKLVGIALPFSGLCPQLKNDIPIIVSAASKRPTDSSDACIASQAERLALKASADRPHPNLQRSLVTTRDQIITPLAVTSLDKYFKAGPMPMHELLKLHREVAQGLEHLHQLGYLHLDIKPENILINAAGSAILSDIGGHTKTSIQDRGYIGFSFPEISEIGKASDVYGFAGMLFESLTLEKVTVTEEGSEAARKFAKRLDPQRIDKILSRVFPPSIQAQSGVEGKLVAMLKEGLSVDPNKRPPLSDFISALKAFEHTLRPSKS